MACGRPSFTNRFLRFLGSQSAKEAKKKPSTTKETSAYGSSPLTKVYSKWFAHNEYLKHMQTQWARNDNTFFTTEMLEKAQTIPDNSMEVFLDDNGNIIEPLKRGISFDFCSIDRWYMPDCVPGIRSLVDITYVGRPASRVWVTKTPKIITVLFANNRYIHLAPREIFYIESKDEYFGVVEAHFVRRGIDHITDVLPNSEASNFPKNAVQGQIYNQQAWMSNGQPNKAVGSTNNRTFGGRTPNVKITNIWDLSLNNFYIANTPVRHSSEGWTWIC